VTAMDKTGTLERKDLPVELLVPNADNPNKMRAREFDLLCDNLEQTGITDPILVRPLGDGKYRIVGGHHRFDAANFLGFTQVPCTIITDPDFDEEAERFQLVRMNVIRGRMDPQAFYELYLKVADKYGDDVLQDAFGFAEEAEFKKLVEQTTKSIPDAGMRQRFKEAAKEIKTIDGLARLLNELFTKYGDTLPYGYMVFDYGGQRSVWLQVEAKTLQAFDVVGTICIERQRTIDDLVGGLLQLIAKGECKALLEQLIEASPEVELPEGLQLLPTKAHVDQVASL
jgi:hypothetical protein